MTLGALGLRQFTGELTLDESGKIYRIAFDHGAVVGASSPAAGDSAARLAVINHLIAPSLSNEVARRIAAAPDRDEVEVIAETARLGIDQIVTLRRKLIELRAARTFAAESGVFVMDTDVTVPTISALQLDVRRVIFLGAWKNLSDQRLTDELRPYGHHFVLVPESIGEIGYFGFTDAEKPILEALRAGTSLAEFEVAHRDFDPRTARAVVYALVMCQVCKGTAPPSAIRQSDPGASNGELRVTMKPRDPTNTTPGELYQRTHTGTRDVFQPRTTNQPEPRTGRTSTLPPGVINGVPQVSRTTSGQTSAPRTLTREPSAPRTMTGQPAEPRTTTSEPRSARTSTLPPSGPRTMTSEPRSRPTPVPSEARTQTAPTEPPIARTTTPIPTRADSPTLAPTEPRTSTLPGGHVAARTQTPTVPARTKTPTAVPARTQTPTTPPRGSPTGAPPRANPPSTPPTNRTPTDPALKAMRPARGSIPPDGSSASAPLADSTPPPDPVSVAKEAAKRGESRMKVDDFVEAIAEFSKAVELTPNEVDYAALLAWARFCAASDRQSLAVPTRETLGKAVRKSQTPEKARFYLGKVERMLGRDREALRHFQEVLEVQPKHADAAAEIRAIEARLASASSRDSGIFGRKR